MNKTTDHSDEKAYRRMLFELGSLVNGNRARSHAHRSQIIDNVTNGLSSLLTAFSRNRNLMSESTTNIYRSRRVFLESRTLWFRSLLFPTLANNLINSWHRSPFLHKLVAALSTKALKFKQLYLLLTRTYTKNVHF